MRGNIRVQFAHSRLSISSIIHRVINSFLSNEEGSSSISAIKSIAGVSEVYYTNNKNIDLFVTIEVKDALEGEQIISKIKSLQGVKDAQISLETKESLEKYI